MNANEAVAHTGITGYIARKGLSKTPVGTDAKQITISVREDVRKALASGELLIGERRYEELNPEMREYVDKICEGIEVR